MKAKGVVLIKLVGKCLLHIYFLFLHLSHLHGDKSECRCAQNEVSLCVSM